MSDRRSGPARRRGARIVAAVLVAGVAGLTATSNGAQATSAPSPKFGPVIDAVGYDPQLTCDPKPKVGVLAFRAFAERYFGAGDLGISRACSSGGVSEHKEGRAWDAKYNFYNLSERHRAERLLRWLMAPDAFGTQGANARRWGVMYVIWHNQIWAPYSIEAGWRPYNGPDAHTSHIHISFTWDGALRQTTWYAASKSFLDPYQPWSDTSTAPTEDSLTPVLTVRPVDPPSPVGTLPVLKPKPLPKRLVHKVYDELHGSVISAVQYAH